MHAYIARFALVCRFQSIIRELRSSPPPKTSAWRDAIAHENSERMRGGKLNELCGLDLLPAPASDACHRRGSGCLTAAQLPSYTTQLCTQPSFIGRNVYVSARFKIVQAHSVCTSSSYR